jgi:FlaA1/EpsC-like NDP-sugar epimerase
MCKRFGAKLFLQLVPRVLSLPRFIKRVLAFLVDTCACVITVWLSLYLRLDEFVGLSPQLLIPSLVSLVVGLPIFIIFGLYRIIFRYSGWAAVATVIRAMLVYGILFITIFTVFGVSGIPRTIGVIQPILLFLMISGSRGLIRLWLGDEYQSHIAKSGSPRVLIVGFGPDSRNFAQNIKIENQMNLEGFITEDSSLIGTSYNGIKVFTVENIEVVLAELSIDYLLIASSEISRLTKQRLIDLASANFINVRVMPSIAEIKDGYVSIDRLKQLAIEDVLGREIVPIESDLIDSFVRGKTIVVTGAGGSIGSELSRQVLKSRPGKLLLIDNSELALYTLLEELSGPQFENSSEVIPILASVQDRAHINSVFAKFRPNVVYHAAAYKHVPLVEDNIFEGIKNNVFGTLNVAEISIDCGVENFVLISSDKAVRPTNVMGATKRLAELIVQGMTDQKKNRVLFSMVRFGNVLGSSGSVIPKFRSQIAKGGPLTVTHRDMTRFFMTVTEAAQLVLAASTISKGGDLFLLDMGEPVKIVELAKKMVQVSGFTVKDEDELDGEIEIVYSGLRPGEKLFEELLIDGHTERTRFEKIHRATEHSLPWEIVYVGLETLRQSILIGNEKETVKYIKSLVSEYSPSHRVLHY